jgi:hypothetical protein
MVPGKSLAIIFLTGQVWHPMGMPRGFARSPFAAANKIPAALVSTVAVLKKFLLEIADILAS